jgi:hypothetical protein
VELVGGGGGGGAPPPAPAPPQPAAAVADAHDALIVIEPFGRQDRSFVAAKDDAGVGNLTTGINICDVQLSGVPRHVGVAPRHEAEAGEAGGQARVGVEVSGGDGDERTEVSRC